MSTNKDKTNIYLPKMRTGYAPEAHSLISHGKVEEPSSPLPSTVEDDIVVNNISNAEFDYTEDLNFNINDDL